MFTMEQNNKPSPEILFNMQMIAGAMTASIIVLMLVPLLGFVHLKAPSSEQGDIVTIITAIGVLPPLVAPLIQKLVFTILSKSSKDLVAASMQALIIRYALNEAGTILGFVATLLGGTPYPVIICGLIALVGGVLAFPKKT